MRQKGSKYLLGPVATKLNKIPTGKWKKMKPVILQSACILCKQCIVFCPANIIYPSPSSNEKITIKYEYCKGCGICANVCKNKCILMERDG